MRVDIAGLVRGAHEGEGLGNQFLHHIRTVDAVAQVVRLFDDPDVVHVEGSVGPVRDVETVATELGLADLASVEKRLDRTRRAAKGDKKAAEEVPFLERLLAHLSGGKPARTIEADETERALLRDLFLLTAKPSLYVDNVSEGDLAQEPEGLAPLRAHAAKEGAGWSSRQNRAEVIELPPKNGRTFWPHWVPSKAASSASRGLSSSQPRDIFDGRPEEVRLEIRRDLPKAAGVIHTDFRKRSSASR